MEREFPIPGYGDIEVKGIPPLHTELLTLAGTRGEIVVDYSGNGDYGLANVEYFNDETEGISVSFVNQDREIEHRIITVDEYVSLKKFKKNLKERKSQPKFSTEQVSEVREQVEKIIARNLVLLTNNSTRGYKAHVSEYKFFIIPGKTGNMNLLRASFQFDRLTGEILSFGKDRTDVPVDRHGDVQIGFFDIVLDMAGRLLLTKQSLESGRHNASIVKFQDIGKPVHHEAAKVLAETMAQFNHHYGTDFSEEMGG